MSGESAPETVAPSPGAYDPAQDPASRDFPAQDFGGNNDAIVASGDKIGDRIDPSEPSQQPNGGTGDPTPREPATTTDKEPVGGGSKPPGAGGKGPRGTPTDRAPKSSTKPAC
jgi:hypothetical protein